MIRDTHLETETGPRAFQPQNLKAIDPLIRGMSHDLNNLLTIILSAAELVKDKLGPEDPSQHKLDAILQAARFAQHIHLRALSLGRSMEEHHAPVSLSTVVGEACRLVRAVLPEDIALRGHVASGVWISGDPVQLNEIIINLAINGRHALGENGGVLELSLDAVELDAASLLPGLEPGRHAVLTVQDSGSGMDEATLERIFEPFFTTKGQGGGKGLGLAMVHRIVTIHRGAIQVRSRPGAGSTFRLFFPCRTEQAQALIPSLSRPPQQN